MYNVFRKAKDSTYIHRTVIKQMLTMFLTCDNGLISAIFLRNLCVQKTKPVRSLRNLCVTIDQCGEGEMECCANIMEPILLLERYLPQADLKPRTATSAGQHLAY